MRERNKQNNGDESSQQSVVSAADLTNAMYRYDTGKGFSKWFYDLRDIRLLRALNNNVKHSYLNFKETFEFISILLHAETVQGTLSSEIILDLSEKYYALVSAARLLEKHHAFIREIFDIVQKRLEHIYVIKSMIEGFERCHIQITSAYMKSICQHARYYNSAVPEIVSAWIKVGMSEREIVTALTGVFEKKADTSYTFWNNVRDAKTSQQVDELLHPADGRHRLVMNLLG